MCHYQVRDQESDALTMRHVESICVALNVCIICGLNVSDTAERVERERQWQPSTL